MQEKKKYKYAALCIGINQYDNNKHLTRAENDAEAIANAFVDLGYDVIKLIGDNATYDNYVKAYTQLMSDNFSKLYDAIILYFAGHGFVTNGSDCLAMKDSDEMKVGYGLPAKAKSINVQDFIDAFRKRTTPTLILILDACRKDLSDYMDADMRGEEFLNHEKLGYYVHVPTQTLIAYATSFNSGASDIGGANGHSKYTAALLEYIMEEAPIEKIFKKVRSKVHQKDEDQLPWEYTSLTSEFYFNFGQLDPYYNAEYCRKAFICRDYETDTAIVQIILENLEGKTPYYISLAYDQLLKNKDTITDDEMFIIGRKIYAQSVVDTIVFNKFLSIQTLRQFGDTINHILRGIFYEIYFDEDDNVRSEILGDSEILTEIDKIQSLLKNEDAARFIKKYIGMKGCNPMYKLWDNTAVINIEIQTEEMYCTDIKNNIIYGVRSATADGMDLLAKLQDDIQGILSQDELREQIADILIVPLQRLRIRGLDQDSSSQRKYLMYFIDNIEQQLFEVINYNLPDEVISLSSDSYVDELGMVYITENWYDGSDVYVEGGFRVDIHNEMDGEDMGNNSFPVTFQVKLNYNQDKKAYEIYGQDAKFSVDTDSYYE